MGYGVARFVELGVADVTLEVIAVSAEELEFTVGTNRALDQVTTAMTSIATRTMASGTGLVSVAKHS